MKALKKALLHSAIFRATCLTILLRQEFSHCEAICLIGVALGTFLGTCFAFDNHIILKEHFHRLVPQTVATEVAGQMLHYVMLENSLQRCVKRIAESRTRSCFSQFSATCLGMFLTVARYVTLVNVSCNLSRLVVPRQIASKLAPCNSAFR